MAAHVAKQAAARASRPAVSAGVPILAAKITAPGVPDWAVPRPRITMLIAQGSRWHRLTVVTAPAGAGKTMALASGAAAEPGAVAWVGLDGYGNQPKAFWAYVVAALRRSGMALRTAPPIMRGRDAGHVFLLWLAAALAAQDPPVTLVLDDLHLMTDPEVLDGLDYVLRNVGPGLRLVVSGRRLRSPLLFSPSVPKPLCSVPPIVTSSVPSMASVPSRISSTERRLRGKRENSRSSGSAATTAWSARLLIW